MRFEWFNANELGFTNAGAKEHCIRLSDISIAVRGIVGAGVIDITCHVHEIIRYAKRHAGGVGADIYFREVLLQVRQVVVVRRHAAICVAQNKKQNEQ